MRKLLRAAPLAVTLMTTPLAAQDAPALRFPVDCDLGETCFIQQTVDRDPGLGARDFTCDYASYDGHTGTDIRVPDLEAMAAGVAVLSAAPGTVLAIRDGVPDAGMGAAPEGQACGNGVAITHGGGWETQYCHLRAGSIAVAPGQTVAAGARLGEIGYSGRTEFPHLEFILRHDGQVVDPFDPSDLTQCGLGADALWAEDVPLASGGLLSVGFAGGLPAFAEIRAGTADATRLRTDGDALVLWGFVHNGRPDDVIRFEIRSPDETLYHRQDTVLDQRQAELFRGSGRRISSPLPPGRYIGAVTLLREGVTIDRRVTSVTLD